MKGARLDVVAEVRCRLPLEEQHNEKETYCSYGLITFVHFAIEFCDYDLIEAAIAHGVDLNVRSWRFGGALHLACDIGDMDAIELLIRQGAHVDSVTSGAFGSVRVVDLCFFFSRRVSCQAHASIDVTGRSARAEVIEWLDQIKESKSDFWTSELIPALLTAFYLVTLCRITDD